MPLYQVGTALGELRPGWKSGKHFPAGSYSELDRSDERWRINRIEPYHDQAWESASLLPELDGLDQIEIARADDLPLLGPGHDRDRDLIAAWPG
jgi:hypothetical protein